MAALNVRAGAARSNLHIPPRAWIEAQIEACIALLDMLDGDPDLEDDEREDEPADISWYEQSSLRGYPSIGHPLRCEDDEDDDPAGGNIEDEAEGDDLYDVAPRYGVDQRRGPVNKREAYRQYLQPDSTQSRRSAAHYSAWQQARR